MPPPDVQATIAAWLVDRGLPPGSTEQCFGGGGAHLLPGHPSIGGALPWEQHVRAHHAAWAVRLLSGLCGSLQVTPPNPGQPWHERGCCMPHQASLRLPCSRAQLSQAAAPGAPAMPHGGGHAGPAACQRTSAAQTRRRRPSVARCCSGATPAATARRQQFGPADVAASTISTIPALAAANQHLQH